MTSSAGANTPCNTVTNCSSIPKSFHPKTQLKEPNDSAASDKSSASASASKADDSSKDDSSDSAGFEEIQADEKHS
ncbi:hypothetical protein RG268_00585, partial [Bifidobacterium adolescentis]